MFQTGSRIWKIRFFLLNQEHRCRGEAGLQRFFQAVKNATVQFQKKGVHKKKVFSYKKDKCLLGATFHTLFYSIYSNYHYFHPFSEWKEWNKLFHLLLLFIWCKRSKKDDKDIEQLCKSFSSQIHFPLFSQFFRQIRPSLNSVMLIMCFTILLQMIFFECLE